MNYYTRRYVKPGDLNAANRLFGGQLLSWIDEEAAIFASCQMKRDHIVTKYISEINFMRPGCTGDIIEFGFELVDAGRTSITIKCQVRNKKTQEVIIAIEKLVFVALGENGKPTEHGYVVKSGVTVLPVAHNSKNDFRNPALHPGKSKSNPGKIQPLAVH